MIEILIYMAITIIATIVVVKVATAKKKNIDTKHRYRKNLKKK